MDSTGSSDPHVDARLAPWKPRQSEPDPRRLHANELEAGLTGRARSTLIGRLLARVRQKR